MGIIQTLTLLITLTALFSYLNHRYVKLPTTIGVMAVSLALSLILIAIHQTGWNPLGIDLEAEAERMLASIDFEETLLHGMLGFLLFAGALFVDLNDLAESKWVIMILATVGVVISTFVVGALAWWMFGILGIDISFRYCLVFGALIAPTDPIAVLGVLRSANVPKKIETKIVGESLFNDGVAVVVFLVLLEVAMAEDSVTFGHVAGLFLIEVVGGILLGLVLGYVAYRLIRSVDNYQVEILLTLALVMGGNELARAVHASAPLAIVVAGLFIGNHGRTFAMSEHTREHLDTFWELVDEILNAVLFVLIGLEVLVLQFKPPFVLAILPLIPIMLLARFVSVGATIQALRRWRRFERGIVPLMTWAGLRGGISVALALGIPETAPARPLLLVVTYGLVIFSILIQGMSVGWAANRLLERGD